MKIFRSVLFTITILIGLSNLAEAQVLRQLIQRATGRSDGTPTNDEIGGALKEALVQGTGKSSDQLSALNGYFGNPTVKILFPPEAQQVESTLRRLGLNQLCDNVILSLNRAAEDAAGQAKPIFIDAIKHMTLQDVLNILLGGNDSATQYFRKTTTVALGVAFRPIVQNSLNKVGATRYYSDVASRYNKIPFVPKVNPDITDYVTQKAIDGLFIQIAVEELNIRQNLAARSTPLMQKVFAFAATHH